jgi:IS5 family transposase
MRRGRYLVVLDRSAATSACNASGPDKKTRGFPHENSDLSHWRKRLGDKLELLLAESLRVAHASGALQTRDRKRVTVDTTVQPKAITFPTNAKLLDAAMTHRQARRNDGGALRLCQTVQSPQSRTAHCCAAALM